MNISNISKYKKLLLVILFSVTLLSIFSFIFYDEILCYLSMDPNQNIPYSPGKVKVRDISSTGAIVVVTQTWSNISMKLCSPEIEAELYIVYKHNSSISAYTFVCGLTAPYFLSKVANGREGSIEFVDVDKDGGLSVGDMFYLGSYTKGGNSLLPNTTYYFCVDDDSPNKWEIEFTTRSIQ